MRRLHTFLASGNTHALISGEGELAGLRGKRKIVFGSIGNASRSKQDHKPWTEQLVLSSGLFGSARMHSGPPPQTPIDRGGWSSRDAGVSPTMLRP